MEPKKIDIDRVLDIVDLSQHAERKAGQYSLGMRQRLGLARALLGNPKLLILDEPTNGLDPAGIREMRALIKDLPERQGATIFMSSHLLSEIEQTANHVALMREGRVIYQNTLSHLMSQQRGDIRIRVDDPAQAAEIANSQGFVVKSKTDKELHLIPPATLSEIDMARLNTALVDASLHVSQLNLSTPDLEAIFMDLTQANPTKMAS